MKKKKIRVKLSIVDSTGCIKRFVLLFIKSKFSCYRTFFLFLKS